MFLGFSRHTDDKMENETARLPKSRVPPKSKFNDEEATAILRLIVEQEKILNDATVSPVLNITADKLKKLPPLPLNRESVDDDDELEISGNSSSHGNRHQENSCLDALLCKPTLTRAREQKEIAVCDNTKTLGKAKIPHIYSTPRIVRRRGKERPRESYGRASRNERPQTYRQDSLDKLDTSRPGNPGGFHTGDDMKFRALGSPERSDVLQLSDELLDRPICPVPPRTTTPPSYINWCTDNNNRAPKTRRAILLA